MAANVRRLEPEAFISARPRLQPLPKMVEGYRISVVIPALNEAENLPHVLPRIPAWIDEIILVDGHSTDNTSEIARALDPRVRVVLQDGKGKGAALRSGFGAVTGDIIVMLDADGSTDPAEIPAFIGPLLAGADFAKGSRFIQGGGTADMSVVRRVGNWAFVTTVQLFHGGRFSDLCYGYNAFWTRVLPRLDLDGDGFEIETIMNVRALRCGLKVVEVPSFEKPRIFGQSRLRTIPDGWRVLKAIGRETLKKWRWTWGRMLTRDAPPVRTIERGASVGYAIGPSDGFDLTDVR